MLDGTGKKRSQVSGAREFDENCWVINFAHVDDALVGVRGLAGGERAGGHGSTSESECSERHFSKHYFDHAGYDARGPHGISGIEARADAESGCAGGAVGGFYARLRAGSADHGVARHHSHGHVSAVSSGARLTYPLAKDLPYAPDILRAHGYRTAAFLGSLVLDAGVGAPGFDRGLTPTILISRRKISRAAATPRAANSAPAAAGSGVVARALAWLKQHPEGPFSCGAFVRCARSVSAAGALQDKVCAEPYDGGIAYEDSVVGTLLQQLKARGLYDGATIAVMADHGESLGAHGEDTHGIFLYDETIRVPLLIKLPGASATGTLRRESESRRGWSWRM